jgi:hypothetical protein
MQADTWLVRRVSRARHNNVGPRARVHFLAAHYPRNVPSLQPTKLDSCNGAAKFSHKPT